MLPLATNLYTDPVDLIGRDFMEKLLPMGISSPADLLLYLPTKYTDYRHMDEGIQAAYGKKKALLKLRVAKKPESKKVGQRQTTAVRIVFSDGIIESVATIFGLTYKWMSLKEGDIVHVKCKIEDFNGRLQIKSPERIPKHYIGKIIPSYKIKEGAVEQEAFYQKMILALNTVPDSSRLLLEKSFDMPEQQVLSKSGAGFAAFSGLFAAIHSPRNKDDILNANQAVRKINALHALLENAKAGYRHKVDGAALKCQLSWLKSLVGHLPFTMTNDQKRATWDIFQDLNSEKPMNRLLSGDVGCGKTVSYALPALCAAKAGGLVVVLAPNSALAGQIASEFSDLDPSQEISLLVNGSPPPDLSAGNPIVVGTTAIVHWYKKLKNRPPINLLVSDEQQKLGVEQKESLLSPQTNHLEATATAIPKTAAAVLFGGMGQSLIEEIPVEKNIVSEILYSEDKGQVMDKLRGVLDASGQIAIMYPLRKGAQAGSGGRIRHVEAASERWEKLYPGQVITIHGGLSQAEKDDAISRAKLGKGKVIVTTSILEIGLTIPNLRGFLIVNPERYGAFELHQLRGRLARKGGDGLFLMLLETGREDTKAETLDRLKLLLKYTKGSDIARESMKQRGFGDLGRGGVKQSGFLEGVFKGLKITPSDTEALARHLLSTSRESVKY